MDKVELYYDYVGGAPVLIAGPVGGLIAFMLVPGRLRMGVALVFLMVWLVLGLLVELQPFAAIAKATGIAAYLLVAISAGMHPGPRRRLVPMAWVYVVLGLFSYMFILTVWDLPLALVIRTQWLFLTIAALMVARTIVDEQSLLLVLKSLTIGLAIALLLPLSDFLLHPGQTFANRRFNPYDSTSNHIGVLFALAAPFCMFMAMRPGIILRFGYIVGAALAAAMGLLTASRSTMFVIVGMSFPMIVALTKRPILTVIAAVTIFGTVSWFLSQGDEVNLERFGSLYTGRIEIAQEYLQDVISERPFLGLLETSGESFWRSEEEAAHPHNAYLQWIYYGGFVYAVPNFILVAYTMWCVLRMWLYRKNLPYDPLLISFLAAAMVMTYAHGFVNSALEYPTTTLSFMHILLSVLIMCLAREVSSGTEPVVRQVHEDLEWADVDYE